MTCDNTSHSDSSGILLHWGAMKFRAIDLPVNDPDRWTTWMSSTLGLPSAGHTVTLGWTQLSFVQDAAADRDTSRGHHLAFAIPAGTVKDAGAWTVEVTGTPLLRAEDPDGGGTTSVIDRGGNWPSRSIYFAGPENSVLELIEHTERPTGGDSVESFPGQFLGVAEVGLGVADVAVASSEIEENDDLPYGFGDPGRRVIAAFGDIDGAVILARDDRPWFPTDSGHTDSVLPVTSPPTIRTNPTNHPSPL